MGVSPPRGLCHHVNFFTFDNDDTEVVETSCNVFIVHFPFKKKLYPFKIKTLKVEGQEASLVLVTQSMRDERVGCLQTPVSLDTDWQLWQTR